MSDSRDLVSGDSPQPSSATQPSSASNASTSSFLVAVPDTPDDSESPHLSNGHVNNDDDWRIPFSEFQKTVPIPSGKDRRSAGLCAFYERQNKLVEGFTEAERLISARKDGTIDHLAMEKTLNRNKPAPAPIRHRINISFAANILLFSVKVVAAIYSGSLAVIVSAVDSSLDLLSGSILFAAARIAARKDAILYPVGKSRLEPIAVIVFASCMGVAALQLVIEAITRISEDVSKGPQPIRIDAVSYAVIGATIFTKACLWLYCFPLRKQSDSVAALTQDHRNDVITNSATLVALILLGSFPNLWYLDPITAIILGILIVITWAQTGKRHIVRLTGRSGDPDQLAVLTYLAMFHDRRIVAVDTVLGYYTGARLLVEVDIVLPSTMQLGEGHEVGESLQREMELLDFVERAFVHLDVDTQHSRAIEHVVQ